MAEETKGAGHERAMRGVQMETLGDAIRDFYKYVSGPSAKRRPAARILGKIWGVDVVLAEHPVEHWEPGRALSKRDELWVAGSLSDVTKAIQFEVNDRARCCGPALERAVIPTHKAAMALLAEMKEDCLYFDSWLANKASRAAPPAIPVSSAVDDEVLPYDWPRRHSVQHESPPCATYVLAKCSSRRATLWQSEVDGTHYAFGVDPGFEDDKSTTVVVRLEQSGARTVVWSGDTPSGGWTHDSVQSLTMRLHGPKFGKPDAAHEQAALEHKTAPPCDPPRPRLVQREWPFFKEVMTRPFDPLKEVKPSLLAAAALSMSSLRQIDEDQARLALRQAANRAGLDQDKAVRTATEIAMSTGRPFAEVCDSERQAILAGDRTSVNWFKVWCRYLVDCDAFDRSVPHKISEYGDVMPSETCPSQQYARKRRAELLATCPDHEEAACRRRTNHLSYEGFKAHAANDDDLRTWGLWRPSAESQRAETRDVFDPTTGKFSTLTVTTKPRDQERDTVRIHDVKNTFDMTFTAEVAADLAQALSCLRGPRAMMAGVVEPTWSWPTDFAVPTPSTPVAAPPVVEKQAFVGFAYSPGERDPFPIGQAPGETEAWARALAILKAGG